MKIKRTILLLTVVSLLVAVPTFGLKEYGDLDPPILTLVWSNPSESETGFGWIFVPGAVKYSVDIEGVATYDLYNYSGIDPVLIEAGATAEVEVSFGTSDRTDDGEMGDPDLTITHEEFAAAIAAELGIPVVDVISLAEDWAVKVKALAPGKDKGRQNNEFSNSIYPFWSVEF